MNLEAMQRSVSKNLGPVRDKAFLTMGGRRPFLVMSAM